CRDGRKVEQLLHEQRKQYDAAVKREEQRQGEAGSRGKCAIAEQTEVNDGIFRVQLPKSERDQPDHRDHRHGNDEVRTEPVVLLAFVKDNLERGNADGKQTDAPIINPCCWTSNVWRIEDVPRDENQSNDADRQIDKEDPAPGIVRGQPSAEHGCDDGRNDDAYAPKGHGVSALLARKGFQHDGPCSGLERTSCQPLQHPENNQRRQSRSKTAQNAGGGKSNYAHDQQPPAAEIVRQPSGKRKDDGICHQVGRQDPGGFINGRREIAGNVGQAYVYCRRVNQFHNGADHDGKGNEPARSLVEFYSKFLKVAYGAGLRHRSELYVTLAA